MDVDVDVAMFLFLVGRFEDYYGFASARLLRCTTQSYFRLLCTPSFVKITPLRLRLDRFPFGQHHAWNQLVPVHLQFLKTFVDGHFTDVADELDVALRGGESAAVRHKVHNARGNGRRRVFCEIARRLDLVGNKVAQFGQFPGNTQLAAVALQEGFGFGRHKHRLFLAVFFDFVEYEECVLASARGAACVEVEDGRQLLGGARVVVDAARQVDGRCNDSVTVVSAKGNIVLGNTFVEANGIVNDELGNARIVRHGRDDLEFVVL